MGEVRRVQVGERFCAGALDDGAHQIHLVEQVRQVCRVCGRGLLFQRAELFGEPGHREGSADAGAGRVKGGQCPREQRLFLVDEALKLGGQRGRRVVQEAALARL